MAIVDGGWLDWAERVPDPKDKVYSQANEGSGIVCHSMEGSYVGSLGELMNPGRQASWMFSNTNDGRFIQHYPISASPWASGNSRANTSLWSVESEGYAGSPLNARQTANMIRLAREWQEFRADKPSPRTANRHEGSVRSIWEHREVATWVTPNAGPTSCPSGRYEPFFQALEAPDMALTAEQLNDALQKRMALTRLANNPDLTVVVAAVEVLEKAGIKP